MAAKIKISKKTAEKIHFHTQSTLKH